MASSEDYRRGRHVVSALHVHLVFVTRHRRDVLTGEMIGYLAGVFQKVPQDFGARLTEFNGADGHVHLLIEYPPKVTVPGPGELAQGRVCAPAPAAIPGPHSPGASVVPVLPRRILRRDTAEHHPPVRGAAAAARRTRPERQGLRPDISVRAGARHCQGQVAVTNLSRPARSAWLRVSRQPLSSAKTQ